MMFKGCNDAQLAWFVISKLIYQVGGNYIKINLSRRDEKNIKFFI